MVVERADSTLLVGEKAEVNVSTWKEPGADLHRVVFLIHGFMMHGISFDSLARHLAGCGSLVVAPDLRGFGRSYKKNAKIDYLRSLDELSSIVRILKNNYPQLPLFCAGESLGAHFARRIAAAHPELLSGLILSSPCVRPNIVSVPLIPHACSELVLSGLNPQRQFNLSPFAEQFLKLEEHNLRLYLEDPLTRKSLKVWELIESMRVAEVIEPSEVHENIPILVLKGREDRVCKASSTREFLHGLRKKNMTVYLSPSSGHIILQSKMIQNDVLVVLNNWMRKCSEVGKKKQP